MNTVFMPVLSRLVLQVEFAIEGNRAVMDDETALQLTLFGQV